MVDGVIPSVEYDKQIAKVVRESLRRDRAGQSRQARWHKKGSSGGGGDFAVVLPTGEPAPGIGFTCDAAEATIITTSCGSRFQPGDVIYIWDLCRNWLNMPVELLTQTTFNVQYCKIHEDEYNRPPSLTGTCRWVVTGMCCVESSVYEY